MKRQSFPCIWVLILFWLRRYLSTWLFDSDSSTIQIIHTSTPTFINEEREQISENIIAWSRLKLESSNIGIVTSFVACVMEWNRYNTYSRNIIKFPSSMPREEMYMMFCNNHGGSYL